MPERVRVNVRATDCRACSLNHGADCMARELLTLALNQKDFSAIELFQILESVFAHASHALLFAFAASDFTLHTLAPDRAVRETQGEQFLSLIHI